MFKHLLLPIDGSPLSLAAAQRAISFASEGSARITVFYARGSYSSVCFGEGALMDPTSPEEFDELTQRQANNYLEEVATLCRDAGVECETLSMIDDIVYQAIIDAAEQAGCDLIFMASHGRRGLASLLLGSETQKVLTHTNIPVLVYR